MQEDIEEILKQFPNARSDILKFASYVQTSQNPETSYLFILFRTSS